MSEKLKGMRTLSDAEVKLMNDIADLGNQFGDLITSMADTGIEFDPRWTATGKTHLQVGIMCLKRAVGKPENF